MKRILSLLLPLCLSVALAKPADLLTTLPDYGPVKQTEYTGYAQIAKNEQLFYWFVAADHHASQAPIIIWSSGGPGTSSLYGFFLENGPYQISASGQLSARATGWNHFANYLVFDQPMGIGLSFTDKKAYPKTPEQGTEQFYQALVYFLKQHPQYQHNPIYLSGESYAGTYLALLAQKIVAENKRHPKTTMNLKGLILISGWVDPLVQQSADADYAYYHGLISKEEKQQVDARYQECQKITAKDGANSVAANTVCSNVGNTITHLSALNDMHDIGLPETIQQDAMVKYLNTASVRQAVHANTKGNYQISTDIWDNYASNEQNDYKNIYAMLLKKHIKLIIFSGLNDGSDCNYLGTERWLSLLDFSGKKAFWSQNPKPWQNKNKITLGYIQQGGDLTWVKVLNAGHMVPVDQPKMAELVKQFVLGA